ncbi:S ribonuclease [Pyrus ussuriensis x Pyrus communis]|uniref:S ribonuclease n=1 Tax=Pyrus ussuriensis x Pyrus communis TaxID=2448454 RepID=A0A5N5GYK2_9ROSA|nr:S ribonuclease [Pyrus ussuriensis x Pyrus communis]
MRKLLEFDFSTAIDGAIKDGTAKIGVVKDEVSTKWLLPPDHLLLNWSSTENLNGLQASSPLSLSLAETANKALSSAPSLDALKFGIGITRSRGARLAQLRAMVTNQGLLRTVEQVGINFRLLFPVFGSFMLQMRCMWSVHCQNIRFVIGRVDACRDIAGEVLHLPLSYFGTPRLGHAARANSLSGYLSTLCSPWACCHGVGPLTTATVVPVAAMVVVLLGGKVTPLAIVLSLVDCRGGAMSCPSSFDLDL